MNNNRKVSAMPKAIMKCDDGTQIWRDKTPGEVLAEMLYKEERINKIKNNCLDEQRTNQ